MPSHRKLIGDTPNVIRIRDKRDVDCAKRVLMLALSDIASDIGRELILDLLNQESTKPEAYDADRLFRIAVLDEGYLPETAHTLYQAALLLLEERGVL